MVMPVSIVRMAEPLESLRKAVALCDGFAGLNRHDRVLVKPNVSIGFRLPPYGMTTTTSILEGLIQLLTEQGCSDISIAEGSIEVLGFGTQKGYERTQIDRLAKKYGVRLIDLNRGPFQQVDLGGLKVQIAMAALETDFLINVPVLKTHGLTRVSLGFKNLKGCLSPTSKTKFHGTNRLNHLIYLLNEVVKCDLTVIDGTYMLEMGPDTVLGTAYRKDLVIASKDRFGCDVVGATILGIDPYEVGYLREFAEAHGRTPSIDAIEIEGEKGIDALREKLRWKPDVAEELLTPSGVTGLSIPYPGESLCSRCYVILCLAVAAFINENPNRDFGDAVIYCGKDLQREQHGRRTILYGNCAIKNHSPETNTSKTVKGCPPQLPHTLSALSSVLLSRPRALRIMPVALLKLAGAGIGIYSYSLPKWNRYRSNTFDKKHFQLSRHRNGTAARPRYHEGRTHQSSL
jgi:uncharacterized protein (DUF362 family)